MVNDILKEALLEGEIIKKAALAQAENSILEKFAPQVKEELNKLLEAEFGKNPEDDELNLGNQETDFNPTDPMTGLGKNIPGSTMDQDNSNTGVPDLTLNVGDEEGSDLSNMSKNLPFAATEGEKLCSCPDEDEEIEIDFGELEQQMKQANANKENDKMAGLGEPTGLMEETENSFKTDHISGICDKKELDSKKEPYSTNLNLDENLDEIEVDENTLKEALMERDDDLGTDLMEEEELDEDKKGFDPKSMAKQAQADAYRDSLNASKEQEKAQKDKSFRLAQKGQGGSRNIEFKENQNKNELFQKVAMFEEEQDLETSDLSLEEAVLNAVKEKLDETEEVKNNPWAICSASTGREDKTKYERCVQDVKKQHGIKQENIVSNINENKTNKQNTLLLNENKELKNKNKELIREFNEIKQKFNKVIEQIEDTNILNTQLLYKNQALCNTSLNERQKVKFVDAISKATSVEQVKTVYETLITTVGSFGVFDKHSNKFSNHHNPQSLREAAEVKNINSLFVNRNKQELVSSDPQIDRMKALAGIVKKK